MSAETLDKPRAVVIRYMTDIDPSPEHPSGFRAGQSFECPSEAVAAEHHPAATIVGYAGGGAYPDDAAGNAQNAT